MHKSFEDPIDFLPDVTPRQQIVVVRPKILPVYDWLRFRRIARGLGGTVRPQS